MLRAEISEALKSAMKAKDQRATSTLRLILAALKDRDIAARGRSDSDEISDDEILELLQKMIRQRHEDPGFGTRVTRRADRAKQALTDAPIREGHSMWADRRASRGLDKQIPCRRQGP